jgi:hypothetical protein
VRTELRICRAFARGQFPFHVPPVLGEVRNNISYVNYKCDSGGKFQRLRGASPQCTQQADVGILVVQTSSDARMIAPALRFPTRTLRPTMAAIRAVAPALMVGPYPARALHQCYIQFLYALLTWKRSRAMVPIL